jgi:hypothetical protein
MKFCLTHGTNSRVRKLELKDIHRIRKMFAQGGRGKANAWKFGISPAHFNRIGRVMAWKVLE